MLSDTDIFQQIVAPAVLIPACGLLLMSNTARLNTILARIRSFHAERLEIWQHTPEAGTPAASVRTLRLEGLEFQSHRLLRRAALLRLTMIQLLLAIASNLISALGLVAIFISAEMQPTPVVGAIPGVMFAFGILLLLGATTTGLIEVSMVLETVRYEHERVERLCATTPCGDAGQIGPDPRTGEGTGI
jgi:hypothetical protein